MEIDAAIQLWTESSERTTKAIREGYRPRPIHKPTLSGAVNIGAIPPALALVEITPHVPTGRVWNVLSTSIFGADSHTPVNAPILSSMGANAAPAAAVNISGSTPLPEPSTVYALNYTVTVSGTTTLTDASNFRIRLGSTIIFSPLPNPEPGTLSGSFLYTTSPQVSGTGFNIQNIAAGSAGTEYAASIQAVPQNVNVAGSTQGVFCDIYGGSLMPEVTSNEVVSPVMSDLIVSAADIPSVNYVPDKAIWLHQDETIYGVIANPPPNTQFVLTARIGEYRVQDVEALNIP